MHYTIVVSLEMSDEPFFGYQELCENNKWSVFARIIGKISALTILQYVNFIDNKPIGRIKYALN